MNSAAADLLLSMFIAGLEHMNEIAALIKADKVDGHDITLAQVETVFDNASLGRAQLTLDIAKAKAAGR